MDDIAALNLPENHPRGVLWRMVVVPLKPKEVTKGGILLPSEVERAEKHCTCIGIVISMGSLCFKGKNFSGMDEEEKPQIGDYIIYGKYAGQQLNYGEHEFVIINDDEYNGRILSPDGYGMYLRSA